MPNGILFSNDAGVAIDSSYRNHALVYSTTVAAAPNAPTRVSLPAGIGAAPLVLLSPGSARVGGVALNEQATVASFFVEQGTGAQIGVHVYSDQRPVMQGSDHGIEVYDDQGIEAFSSRRRYFEIVDVLVHPQTERGSIGPGMEGPLPKTFTHESVPNAQYIVYGLIGAVHVFSRQVVVPYAVPSVRQISDTQTEISTLLTGVVNQTGVHPESVVSVVLCRSLF